MTECFNGSGCSSQLLYLAISLILHHLFLLFPFFSYSAPPSLSYLPPNFLFTSFFSLRTGLMERRCWRSGPRKSPRSTRVTGTVSFLFILFVRVCTCERERETHSETVKYLVPAAVSVSVCTFQSNAGR